MAGTLTTLQRVLRFVEHPLFLAVFGIIGGVLALVFRPFWALVAGILALGLHRSGAVADKGRAVQTLAYVSLLTASGALFWWISGLIRRNLDIPTANEVAQAVWLSSQRAAPAPSPERPPSDEVETPNVLLFPEPSATEPKKLALYNLGKKNFFLCGDKFGDEPPDMMDDCVIDPANLNYYLFTNRLEQWARGNIGPDGERLVPLEMYFMDEGKQKKFVGSFRLLIIMKGGRMEIDTQYLGVVPDDWDAAPSPLN